MKESSKWPLIVLLIAIPLLAVALYWYVNTPKVPILTDNTLSVFNNTKSFDSPGIQPYGEGHVVIVPYFRRNDDIRYMDLGVTIWAKELSKGVQIKEISLEGVKLPRFTGTYIAASDLDAPSTLRYADHILMTQIPVEEIFAAASAHRNTLNLTMQVEVNENVPQRRVYPMTLTYPFKVRTQHITPWNP